MALYHLGIDDTDSLKRGCTTYIAALLIDRLLRDSRFLDYPNLIRLNPNIPWKSRGNAAVCLRCESDLGREEILEMAVGVVEEERDRVDEKNQPGIAILEGKVPTLLKEFGRRALWDVITPGEAVDVAAKAGVKYRLIGGGRGLVGALASIGNTLEKDHTFELVVYRQRALWGRKRVVDRDSVFQFDRDTAPNTFNNVDKEEDRLLITPHGPDPILFGVRGESPEVVLRSLSGIKYSGGERWVLYRSNQGTGAHLFRSAAITDLRPYQAAVIQGTVCRTPRVLKGGHVIASLRDDSGEIDISAYEPSGGFRHIVRKLVRGDRLKALGGVRLLEEGKLTFNLEGLELLSLVGEVQANPVCPNCGKSMKSEGREGGFQCKRCGLKGEFSISRKLERKVKTRTYLPPPRAMRHLTKPLTRYGMEKRSWHGKVQNFYGVF